MTHVFSELDVEAALQHPRSFFAEPKDVVAHPTLSREMKLAILREWELDARRLSASEGERFCGGGGGGGRGGGRLAGGGGRGVWGGGGGVAGGGRSRPPLGKTEGVGGIKPERNPPRADEGGGPPV